MIALYELIKMMPDSFEPIFSERLNELFIFLKNQKKDLSEKEAAEQFLYSNDKGKYFNKLKNELKREIVQYIILNPLIWVNKAYKAQHEECYKKFATYKILLMSGRRKAAIDLAKKLLPQLEKFEHHGLINIVATDLRSHYSSFHISASLAEKYDEICHQQVTLINAELQVRKYHCQVAMINNTRSSYSPKNIEQLREAEIMVRPYLKLESNYLNRFVYDVILSRSFVEFDYKKIIETCDNAINSIPLDYQNYVALKFSYIQKKIPALISFGRLKEAKENAMKACQMMPKGNVNWHIALIRRINICLHSGDYQEAYDLYKTHQDYKCNYPTIAEYWNIIWGFLYFLIKASKINAYSEERFHLGKFINEMPVSSKDKSGNNINIFIIQIIIRMQRQQFGQIIDSVDALRSYVFAYTKNQETSRANIFLNMILQMEKASFHRVATERKTQKLLKRLKETPLHKGQNLALEIVPYEVLWEELLNMMDNKFRGVTSRKSIKK